MTFEADAANAEMADCKEISDLGYESNLSTTLNPADFVCLNKSYITPNLAKNAGIYRVDSLEGARLIGHKPRVGRDYSGLVFPYRWPGEKQDREYRLRRDNPDLEQTSKGIKEKSKYLSPPGKGNMLYFPPQALVQWLSDAAITACFVEGEKKTLALQRFFTERGENVFVIGLSGVWNWRGVVGKDVNENGKRQNIKGVISDIGRIEWQGREVEIIFDADARTNHSVVKARKALAIELRRRGALVHILEMPDASETNCKGIDDLLGNKGPDFVADWLTEARNHAKKSAANDDEWHNNYRASSSGLLWRKTERDGQFVAVPLCNFIATITGDVTEDDGTETRRCYEITAQLADEAGSRKGIVAASEFSSLKWIDEMLGAKATVYPTKAEHVRCAIKLLSDNIQSSRVITHTGWRNDDENGWYYYHSNGAIGANGLIQAAVKLPPALAPFILPAPPQGEVLVRAIRSVIELFDVATDHIIIPLIGSVFAAVLTGADFSVHLTGHTGTGKSQFAALMQSYFGAGFDAPKLPASWSSTGNALEGIAHAAKDAILTVDDFCPAGSATDISRLHATADRILRAQGNHSGRGRMRADGSLRANKPPRGLILSTGEDIPKGQSLRARLLVLELEQGATNWLAITECQRQARNGIYAQTMSAFIQWLGTKNRIAQIQLETLPKLQMSFWREQWLSKGLAGHKRCATTLASLSRAWHLWIQFGVEIGAFTDAEGKELWDRIWKALGEAGKRQGSYQASENPTIRFMELIQSALASGKAYLSAIDEGKPENAESYGWRDGSPLGERIGWIDDDNLYLIPDAAYSVAQKTGDGVTVTQSTLWKRLNEAGFLRREGSRETLKVRKKIGRQTQGVLHLKTEIFSQDYPMR